MDKRVKNGISNLEEENEYMAVNIEIKKKQLQDELYTKNTLSHLIERMKEDLMIIRKDINTYENMSQNLEKEVDEEKIIENKINAELNKNHLKILDTQKKNLKDKNENSLIVQYYKTIIQQKWSFIQSADDRKSKQEEIAKQAKNDTQDKDEVEKRKTLNLCKLYNKYLRRKMETELKENEKLEETFQTIKSITVKFSVKIGNF